LVKQYLLFVVLNECDVNFTVLPFFSLRELLAGIHFGQKWGQDIFERELAKNIS